MSARLLSTGTRQGRRIGRLLSDGPRDCPTGSARMSAADAVVPRRPYAASRRRYSSVLPVETIKQSIKSSILEEAAKDDSPFWDSTKALNLNGNDGEGRAQTMGDVERHLGDVTDIDTPIHKHDPLDEWYLDAVSSDRNSNNNNDNSNSNSNISPRIPEGVAPLDPEVNDPFLLSRPDVHDVSETIGKDLLGTDHPVLNSAARYFFEGNDADGRGKGKQVRPVMVMLLSRAMAITNAGKDDSARHGHGNACEPSTNAAGRVLKSQRRLAEITEMIHTASLFHDDVIDGADTRRGRPAAHRAFGNKMAILAGDYLLARASIFMARLRDVDVVECMSTSIENLVRGEVLQIKDGRNDGGGAGSKVDVEGYLRKNFYKTASLMAYSCKSTALLGGDAVSPETVDAAYLYGKHVGVAFQLIDDALDFEGDASSLGKPALADLNAGLSTAPVLFAAESHGRELIPAMARKFREEGDVEMALRCVEESDGVWRTKKLAAIHAERAIHAVVTTLEPSPYRDALVHLACRVIDRSR